MKAEKGKIKRRGRRGRKGRNAERENRKYAENKTPCVFWKRAAVADL